MFGHRGWRRGRLTAGFAAAALVLAGCAGAGGGGAAFLPPIAALLPIYLIVKQIGMLDNVYTLVILYTSMNLPIAIWTMRSFLAEVPKEILEPAEVDGAGLITTLWRVVTPLVSLPVLIAGFVAQDKLVRGLSLGAVK